MSNYSSNQSTWQAALTLAARGIPVFPLKDKRPLEDGGFHTASTDPARIEQWARLYPGCNWGMPTGQRSGFDVLDIDGAEGLASLEAYEAEHGPLPLTPTQVTGSGGRHYLFATTGEVRNSVKGMMPGWDTRGDGGYIVISPSVHPETGEPYQWLEGLSIVDIEPAPWSEHLLGLYRAQASKRATVEPGARIPLGVQESTLMRMAGAMRRQGCDEAEILAALRVASAERCDPPVLDKDLRRMAASVCRYDPESPLVSAEHTEMGDADRFISVNQQRARYSPEQERHYAYDGKVWVNGKALWARFAQETALATMAAAEAMPGVLPVPDGQQATPEQKAKLAAIEHATKLQSRYKLTAMAELAAPRLPIEVEQLDANPWLFNVDNGTLDLKTGTLRPHSPDDYLTHLAPVAFDPEAQCPTWDAFIERITDGDRELATYLQRIAGYALTGSTNEQCVFVIYGDGQNGKSTFVETLAKLFGDYWLKLPTKALMAKREDGIPNDIARLPGVRMAVANEVSAGRRLDEATVKDLTGDDTITARFMRQEFFDFTPTHKLFLYGNYKPLVRGTDNGIWRRIKLIPFTQIIPDSERDPDLKSKLAAELPGILNWALAGCMAWQAEGLPEPKAVKDATAEYRSEMDVIGQFLEECTERGRGKKAKAADLYGAYQHWCEANGELPVSGKLFGAELRKQGLTNLKSSGVKVWTGIDLTKTGERYRDNIGPAFDLAS